jgi:hypothetical protein
LSQAIIKKERGKREKDGKKLSKWLQRDYFEKRERKKK